MRNRFKAKPNVSAARERAGSSSIDARSRVGSEALSPSEASAFCLMIVGSFVGCQNVAHAYVRVQLF